MSDEFKVYLVRETDKESWRIAVGYEEAKWYPQFKEVENPYDPNEVTSKMIAEYLDQDAENANAHSFLGIHEYLMNVYFELQEESADQGTHAFMMRLLKDGGLHNLE